MAFKFVLFVACAVFASANAGIALTSGSDNTYRSPGNLAQVSTQSKTIDTPYSSSSKTDIRVSNPSVYVTAQPALTYSAHSTPVYKAAPAFYPNQAKLAYAPQPAYNYAQAVPAVHAQAYYPQQQQATYENYAAHSVYPASQQVYAAAPSAVLTKTAYAAPAAYQVAQHAPIAYSAPATYSHAAPAAYSHAAPAYTAAYAHPAPVAAAHQPIVKVTYSPASEVAHLTYSNVNDHINYAW